MKSYIFLPDRKWPTNAHLRCLSRSDENIDARELIPLKMEMTVLKEI